MKKIIIVICILSYVILLLAAADIFRNNLRYEIFFSNSLCHKDYHKVMKIREERLFSSEKDVEALLQSDANHYIVWRYRNLYVPGMLHTIQNMKENPQAYPWKTQMTWTLFTSEIYTEDGRFFPIPDGFVLEIGGDRNYLQPEIAIHFSVNGFPPVKIETLENTDTEKIIGLAKSMTRAGHDCSKSPELYSELYHRIIFVKNKDFFMKSEAYAALSCAEEIRSTIFELPENFPLDIATIRQKEPQVQLEYFDNTHNQNIRTMAFPLHRHLYFNHPSQYTLFLP